MSVFTEIIVHLLASSNPMVFYIMGMVAFFSVIFLYYLRWRDYLLPYQIVKKTSHLLEEPSNILPKLSVVITCNNQAQQVEALLPYLLRQDYPNYEIIFVDESPTDEIKSIIEQHQLRHKNLRYTFVPTNATDICRRKLAITLGIRAARSEWIVITTASGCPTSLQWLRCLGTCIDGTAEIVISYANYIDNGEMFANRAIFERFLNQIRYYRAGLNTAIGGDEQNFCIKKSTFLEHNGYANNLQIVFGESHLLIQTLAEKGNAKIALHPNSIIREQLPEDKVIKNLRIYRRQVLRYSTKHAKRFLWREGTATFFWYLITLDFIIYLMTRTFSILMYLPNPDYLYYVDLSMLILLLITVCLPLYSLRKSAKSLNEKVFGIYILKYAYLQPFYTFSDKVKRCTWGNRNKRR